MVAVTFSPSPASINGMDVLCKRVYVRLKEIGTVIGDCRDADSGGGGGGNDSEGDHDHLRHTWIQHAERRLASL